jgi:dolichol-phosphate mannosyltransferase
MLAGEEPRLTVLHRPAKLGLGTAYVAGFTFALEHGYAAAIEMDADLSHRPVDLPSILHAAQYADVVIGSRNIAGGRAENWSSLRHVLSKGGSLYARLLLKLPVRDCTSGFKCLRRSALETLNLLTLRSTGFGFQIEVNYLCARAGLRFAEVPIIFPDRQHGQSKMSWRITAEAWLMVTRLYLRRGAVKRDLDLALATRPSSVLSEAMPLLPVTESAEEGAPTSMLGASPMVATAGVSGVIP